MKSISKRLLSLALVLMMVVSMVPTVALAAEDAASSTCAAQNVTTGEQYADLNEAISAAEPGQTVRVMADSHDLITVCQDVILDLNGHDLTNVAVSEDVTLSAIDSATDDYEGDFGTLITEGKVAPTVKTTGDVKSYVTVAANGSYSFHRYYASVAAISLKPAEAALGYRAEFRGDETVKNAVVGYGYELWVNDGAHKTYSRTDALEKSSLTLRLKNILVEGNDSLNALGSTAAIGGNAFITLELNGEQVTLCGTEQTTTLRQVVESVNAKAGTYGEAQLEQIRALCTTYAPWMMGWATENIFGAGEGDGDDTGLDVEITVDVTAENNVLTQDATLSYNGITAIVPQGTVLENGTTQLVLTIIEKASSDSDVTEGEGETLIPLDVHIAGISESNTTPIIICLGQILPKGLNIGNYDLHHVENGKTVPMTRVYTLEELDAHNEFHYDPATGAVTVAMASFSELTLRAANTATWDGKEDHTWYNTTDTTLYIYNADQLWSFSQIVGGMVENIKQDSFEGKTVVLHTDIDLNDAEEDGKIFYPIGYYNSEGTYEKTGNAITSGFYSFDGTFDGNGHTISNFYQNTWEMKGDNNYYAAEDQHYRDGMGLFGIVYGGTVKNLTVKDFSSDGEFTTTGTIAAYADCGATFENIAIFNCNPRVYNIGNGGIVGCVGWYAHESNKTVTLSNITVDNTNKISALWGSWDVACGGLVGQYYPTSGQDSSIKNEIHMENCHVTAQIDVYNDVCANYQYYAYRYAGMLIGSVRENETIDGHVYPKMDGITAENCTVGFGDWNDYYYCELVANSLASYTHDHQMSRLEQVKAIEGTTITYLDDTIGTVPASGSYNYVVVNGDHATEHATCYHFVDGAVWNHAEAGEETVDGKTVLKEDKQHIYLEFNNLVTGYGWGVTSKGIGEMDGVTILDKNTAQKFNVYVGAQTTFGSGAVVKLSDLFYSHHAVNTATVQAFVSPVGEDSTVTATYAADKNDWKNGTLTFSGKGAAEIIITDYYFCTATKLTVNVTEYTVSFAVPDGTDAIAPEKSGANGANLPTAHSFTKDGVEYTLVGWTEVPVEETGSLPELLPSPYMATKNTLLYPVYSYSENTSGETTWNLVTDASTLKAGDQIVIAASGSDYALGTTQNNNNRAAVRISKDGNTITINNDVQILTLNSGTKADTFAFYTGSGYLYAASSDNNYLRTESTLSDNSSWTISITNAGVATVKAQGSYTKNLLKKNTQSEWFSCYSSGQNDIALYRKTAAGEATPMYGSFVEACTHNYENGVCTICSAIEPIPYAITDIGKITAEKNVIITMTVGETTYALPNNYGSSNPDVVEVEVVDGKIKTADQNILWNISNIDGNLTIYPAGTTETWLYCTNSTTGLCVGTNANKVFIIDSTYGYLFHTATKRYVGVYLGSTNQDWRCYDSMHTNIAGETLAFYIQEVNCAHENTETVEAVDATCGDAGYTAGTWCKDCETYISGHELIAATGEHSLDNGTETEAATCGEAGLMTYSCTNCDYTETKEIPATGEHTFTNGACTVCGEKDPNASTEPTVLATFELGTDNPNGVDSSNSSSTYEEKDGEYSLKITNGTNMYNPGYDTKGNCCIKIGANSKKGSFQFEVPEEVNNVVIYAVKYGSDSSKIIVNGTTYDLSSSSADAYIKIEVDTSTTKTVKVEASTTSKCRALINTIEFWKI